MVEYGWAAVCRGVGRGVVDRPIECRRVGGALAAELSLIVVDMLELIFQVSTKTAEFNMVQSASVA